MERPTAELNKDANTVWVQADPAVVPVYSFQVGQLMTVIGEVIVTRIVLDEAAANGTDAARAPLTERGSDEMDGPTTTIDAGDEDDAAKSGSAHEKAERPRMAWIRARILRNATGTNMKLYTDALMARRKMMEQLR